MVDGDRPYLWLPTIPNLYRTVTRVTRNGKLLDMVEISFGILSLVCP